MTLTNNDPLLQIKVRAAQIRQTYAQTLIGLITNPLVAGGVVAVLWPVISHKFLLAWLAVHFVLQGARLLTTLRYRQMAPAAEDALIWGRLQTIGSALSGLVWGATFVFLWPADQPLYQMVLPVVIVGLGAGATAGYAHLRASHLSFVLLSHLPFVARFMLTGTSVHLAIGMLGALYIWTLYQVGKNIYDSGVEAMVLNEQLQSNNAQLKTALDSIKTLKGLIPICAQCKKIRDDEGFWAQVEVYISEHSDAEFTHSYCPECAKDFFAGYSE